MPFGLDLKSMVVGALIAYFLLPRVLALFARSNTEG
jgi:hypothetical protein